MNHLSEETTEDGIERVTENSFHDFDLEKEIKNLCDTLVKKYFEDRKYIESKVKQWGDALLEDLDFFCQKKTKYKFYLGLRIKTKKSNSVYLLRMLRNKKQDGNFDFNYKMEFFNIYFEILYITKGKINKTINFDINVFQGKMKKIISNLIDERTFNYKKCKEYGHFFLDDSKKNINLIDPNLYYFCPLIMDSIPKNFAFCYKLSNITSKDIFFHVEYSTKDISFVIYYFIFHENT